MNRLGMRLASWRPFGQVKKGERGRRVGRGGAMGAGFRVVLPVEEGDCTDQDRVRIIIENVR